MHKVAARHLAQIQTGRIDASTLRGLRKLVSGSLRKADGWSVGGGQAVAPLGDLWKVLDAITLHKPAATGELHDSGLEVMRNKRHRSSLPDFAPDVCGFVLVNYELQGPRKTYFVPIWRATTADGRYFDFQNIPWQSGGNGPEVL
jgi:hypothetical protein